MDFKKIVALVKDSIDPKIIKIFLIVTGVFLLLIILLLLNTKTTGNNSANNFETLEKNLKNAAVRYYKKYKEKLPTISGDYRTVTSDELISSGFIKGLSIARLNKTCKGNVKVYQQSKNMYQYVTYIDCGDVNYSSKTLGKEIMKQNIENISSTKDGLYSYSSVAKSSSSFKTTLMGGYIFRGEDPNNYVKIHSTLYRIIKIDADGDVIITPNSYGILSSYDDRYNSFTGNTSGKNEYNRSLLKKNLEDNLERNKSNSPLLYINLVEKNFCVGQRTSRDVGKDGSKECKTIDKNKVSALAAYEYMAASLDKKCLMTSSVECQNYNFLSKHTTWLSTPSVKSSNLAFYISKTIKEEECSRMMNVLPVYALSKDTVISGGSGTKLDPYVVK
ncbi:MAG: hypothetical protein HXK70_06230 [Clostridiales bacterium]|nr:hypothetical protein [Clostridiales bacterium]